MITIPCPVRARLLAALAGVCACVSLHGVDITLIPVADCSLISAAPTNSMGGMEYLICGATQNHTTNRALLRYDIAGNIPAGSKIINASVTVAVSRQSITQPGGVSYGLHRMYKPWGEGNNLASNGPGLGEPALAGDSTWSHRIYPTVPWGIPGGQEDVDYTSGASTTTYIDTVGIFDFESNFDLIAEIQLWLDHPGINFGWMLKAEYEDYDIGFTARRFDSREYPDESLAPQLNISYVPPAILSAPKLTNSVFVFSLPVQPGASYAIESATALGGTNTWSTATNFGYIVTPTNLVFRRTTNAPSRFYRAKIY